MCNGKIPLSFYNRIIFSALTDENLTTEEVRKHYRVLEALAAKGVDLSPALEPDEVPDGSQRISSIREDFNRKTSAAYGLTERDIFDNKSRKQEMTYMRRACYAFLMTKYDLSSGQIAKHFDTFHDRTTIISSLGKHIDGLRYDALYRACFQKLLDA